MLMRLPFDLFQATLLFLTPKSVLLVLLTNKAAKASIERGWYWARWAAGMEVILVQQKWRQLVQTQGYMTTVLEALATSCQHCQLHMGKKVKRSRHRLCTTCSLLPQYEAVSQGDAIAQLGLPLKVAREIPWRVFHLGRQRYLYQASRQTIIDYCIAYYGSAEAYEKAKNDPTFKRQIMLQKSAPERKQRAAERKQKLDTEDRFIKTEWLPKINLTPEEEPTAKRRKITIPRKKSTRIAFLRKCLELIAERNESNIHKIPVLPAHEELYRSICKAQHKAKLAKVRKEWFGEGKSVNEMYAALIPNMDAKDWKATLPADLPPIIRDDLVNWKIQHDVEYEEDEEEEGGEGVCPACHVGYCDYDCIQQACSFCCDSRSCPRHGGGRF